MSSLARAIFPRSRIRGDSSFPLVPALAGVALNAGAGITSVTWIGASLIVIAWLEKDWTG